VRYVKFMICSGMVILSGFGVSTVCARELLQAAQQDQRYVPADAKNAEAGKAAATPATADPAVDAPATMGQLKGYRVGMDDELGISVWHEPELSQVVVVRSDGMITLPLLNDIKVLGLTTEQMQSLLTDKMKSLVNDPQVTVIVRAVRSRKVWLVGNVAKPGVYGLGGQETILEVLTEAGGLGPFAKMRSIYILRQVNGKPVRIGFNYKKAVTGKGENPLLEPGDMVVVP